MLVCLIIINIIMLYMIIKINKNLEQIDYTEIVDNLVTENIEIRQQLVDLLYREID